MAGQFHAAIEHSFNENIYRGRAPASKACSGRVGRVRGMGPPGVPPTAPLAHPSQHSIASAMSSTMQPCAALLQRRSRWRASCASSEHATA